MNNITFTMIKPDAVENGYTGKIVDDILAAKFNILGMKMVTLTTKEAQQFYAVHKEKPFFNDLVRFMCSGPIVVAVLQKDNAVLAFRELIGSTNPANAAPNTIRKKYATSMEKNAVHGSDSDENALIESAFFFATKDLN